MSDAVIIAFMVCVTIVVLGVIGNKGEKKK